MADATLSVQAGALGSGASMRYHELALQHWLNRTFFVREGYPVPVVFATPMDAFSSFGKLWSQANNPFQYLLNAKDEKGTPLYLPHPEPVRYPLISVYRKGWKYRSYQNFTIHRWRHLNWPTVSPDVTKCDLGNTMTMQMPMAWDYRFQINHFATRPDAQAFFLERFIRAFMETGGVPQCWIPVRFPIWGLQLVRLYIDGEVANASPEEVDTASQMEFNTAITVVLEGFSIDVNPQVYPALWYILFNQRGPVDPAKLELLFAQDARIENDNVVLDARENVPPENECVQRLPDLNVYSSIISFGDPRLNPTPADPPQGQPNVWPPQPGFPGGIPSSAAFGVPGILRIVEGGTFLDQVQGATAFTTGQAVEVAVPAAGLEEAAVSQNAFRTGAIAEVTIQAALVDGASSQSAFAEGAATSMKVSVIQTEPALSQSAFLAGGAAEVIVPPPILDAAASQSAFLAGGLAE